MILYISYACNMISSGTTWHSVLYCIHSTPLGGELSGFCFVLHSLRALLLVDGLMVRVGFNRSPWTSLHLPFTSASFPHNIVCVKGLESCSSKRLVSFQRPFFASPQMQLGQILWLACSDGCGLTCGCACFTTMLSLTFAHSLTMGWSLFFKGWWSFCCLHKLFLPFYFYQRREESHEEAASPRVFHVKLLWHRLHLTHFFHSSPSFSHCCRQCYHCSHCASKLIILMTFAEYFTFVLV